MYDGKVKGERTRWKEREEKWEGDLTLYYTCKAQGGLLLLLLLSIYELWRLFSFIGSIFIFKEIHYEFCYKDKF